MPKRLAITIAGAVSLGSYEAGVLYELLRAIRTYNVSGIDQNKKIYIDVITGASAGAMTAAMVAQRLMYNAAALEDGSKKDSSKNDDPNNALYQAWVERISLMGLVKMHWREKKWHSLFSSDLVETIGREMLIDSMRKPGSGPHPAIELVNGKPATLRVGMAITNLNGIDYMIPLLDNPDNGFNYTTSADQKCFDVASEDQANTGLWQRMCDAAVASGAFPVAFRPKGIERDVKEYEKPDIKRLPANRKGDLGKTYLVWDGPDSKWFAYSDGAVLQNQPLGIAKDLVDKNVQDRVVREGLAAYCDAHDRLYVFVAPHSVTSTAQTLCAEKINIWDELVQLGHVYLRQATFHDWIIAEGVNQDVFFLDKLASSLADAIAEKSVDPHALKKTSDALNTKVMPNLEVTPGEESNQARLREQYSQEYNHVKAKVDADAAEAFVSILASLESAARLEKRDKMKIVAVTADARRELAGAGFSSFLGFFKKSYRQHDYWVGRDKTRAYLKRKDVKHILGVSEWPEEDDWKKSFPDPSGVTLPLSKLQIALAGFVPMLIAIWKRPQLLLVLLALLLILAGFCWGVDCLLHQYHVLAAH